MNKLLKVLAAASIVTLFATPVLAAEGTATVTLEIQSYCQVDFDADLDLGSIPGDQTSVSGEIDYSGGCNNSTGAVVTAALGAGLPGDGGSIEDPADLLEPGAFSGTLTVTVAGISLEDAAGDYSATATITVTDN